MQKFSYDAVLTEKSQSDADMKMAGLMVLAAKLSAKEVHAMADVVKNDPVKTNMAKMALGLNK